MGKLHWLGPNATLFPPTEWALDTPNGLLAAGGDLSEQRLLSAYRRGIFPWFSEGEPILWWTPSPRMVLFPEKLHIGRSLRKTLRRQTFTITVNHCFAEVIQACAQPRTRACAGNRTKEEGTWITHAIKEAYIRLHHNGYAHSFEIWQQQNLLGGLYGVAIGQIFFGESMFSRMANASKIAFVYAVQLLKKWRYRLIDCQVYSDHLRSLGAEEIARCTFEAIIRESINQQTSLSDWRPHDISHFFAHREH